MKYLLKTGFVFLAAGVIATAGCGSDGGSQEVQNQPGSTVSSSRQAPAEKLSSESDKGGTSVSIPGAEIKTNADGTKVSLPGLTIQTGEDSANVTMKGLKINKEGDSTDLEVGGIKVNAIGSESTVTIPGLEIKQEDGKNSIQLPGGIKIESE